jgi:hypothetical protein
LYIGEADNGSGHIVFKLDTKQPVSVNRIPTIPTTEAIIKTVNDIGDGESQPEGVEFSDMHGRITLEDFAANDNDDDSNASDADIKMDEEYHDEVKDDLMLEKQEGIIGNDDPDSQEDYFQNPIQLHNNNDEQHLRSSTTGHDQVTIQLYFSSTPLSQSRSVWMIRKRNNIRLKTKWLLRTKISKMIQQRSTVQN